MYAVIQSDCRTGWYVTCRGQKCSPVFRSRAQAVSDMEHLRGRPAAGDVLAGMESDRQAARDGLNPGR